MKDQHITNEIVRNKFLIYPASKDRLQHDSYQKINFNTTAVKVTRNSYNHLPTKLLTAWLNNKRRRGDVLHMNKKSIIHNLWLIITGVGKTGALKTWH